MRNSIVIELEWISRKQNVQADCFCKIFDFDDWSVSEKIFDMCDKKMGTNNN